MINAYIGSVCLPNRHDGKMAYGCVFTRHGLPFIEMANKIELIQGSSNWLAEYMGLARALNYMVLHKLSNEPSIIYVSLSMVPRQLNATPIQIIEGNTYTYGMATAVSLLSFFNKKPIFKWAPKSDKHMARAAHLALSHARK